MHSDTMCFTKLFLLCAVACSVSSAISQDLQPVHELIFADYNPLFPPVNIPVNISANISISKIEELEEADEMLVTWLDLQLTWTDERLAWVEAGRFPDVPSMTLLVDKVWTPRLHVQDSFDREEERPDGRQEDFVELYSSGLIDWHQRVRSKTSCSMDLNKFPLDKQSCNVTYTIKNAKTTEARFTEVNMDDTHNIVKGEWKVKNVTSLITIVDENQRNRSGFTLVFSLGRKGSYYMLYLVWPIFVLVLLCPIALLIQRTSGERISVSVTLFLSFIIIMSQLSYILPNSSSKLPALAWFLYFEFTLSSLVVLCSIFLPHWREQERKLLHRIKLPNLSLDWICFITLNVITLVASSVFFSYLLGE